MDRFFRISIIILVKRNKTTNNFKKHKLYLSWKQMAFHHNIRINIINIYLETN